jgi:hypothetical protein
MKWNPFRSKRGRLVAAAVCLVLVPVAYLASYPVAYRVLIGSDAKQDESVPFRQDACIPAKFSPDALACWKAWQRLEQYYFPPAEWLIDSTPFRTPVLTFARLVDTDEQMEGNIRSRDFRRRHRAVLATGSKDELRAFWDREEAIYRQ